MSEVTVTAVQPVLGLDDGTTVTIERTPRVDAAIRAGRLIVVKETPDEADLSPENSSVAAASTAADDVESPRTKRVKKLAGLDKDDA